MDIQERYDQLSEIVEKLENLIRDLDIKYMDNYISELMYTVEEAKEEMESLEPELRAMRDRDERDAINQYWMEVI